MQYNFLLVSVLYKMATPHRSKSGNVDSSTALPPVLVLYHPSMKTLAESLVDDTKKKLGNLTEGERRRYRPVELCDYIQWGAFKDSWPNIFIDKVQNIAGRDVILIVSFHNPAVVFEQLSLIYHLPRYLIRSFRLILPFFPTATMERIDKEGQIVTAKTMATLLSAIPLAARGPAQIFVFDIHALQERFYFSDTVIPRLLSAIPLLIEELKTLPDYDNLSIAFPDEGAWKRFHSDLDQWPTITCIKVRGEGDNRVVSVKEGNPSGRHVVIVDDLVQTGGTLVECAKALHTGGASKISVFVTHPVFPKESWKKFMPSEESQVQFANFWITDSIPHALEIVKYPPFKLISLCSVIADSLLGYDLVI